jgi:hypothetical protein|nr:MAG TPA: Major capsid protein [Caudoviricetes sp.]
MAVTNFIPELWSARLLNALDKSHVFANVVNRDYEGDIKKMGDTVHINTIGAVTIGTYTQNTDFSSGPETLATTDQTLTIDQAKYFNFQVDDIDAAQAAGDIMDKAMTRAAYGLADASDKYIAGILAGAADASNLVSSSAVALTSSNVYENVVKMRTILDKANVPTAGRWLVIPPEMYALILLDDRFVKTGGEMAEGILRTGLVAQAAGFDIYLSNNCVSVNSNSTDTYTIVGGVDSAATYAEQIVSTEAYRPEKRFADAVKGLHVYGAKVVDKAQIACLKATFA